MINLQCRIFTSEIDIIEWDWNKFQPHLFINNCYNSCTSVSIWVSPFPKKFKVSNTRAFSLTPCATHTTLPTINLGAVNKQMLRRLPDVVYLPVLSCSPDPAFYERNLPCRVLDNHFVSAFGKDCPFGKLPAIYTDLGPIPPPTDPCFGYVWTEEGWRVKAERPPVPDPGGGRGQLGVRKEEDERGGRGWRQREERRRENKLHNHTPTTFRPP